jgi:hypothetical protein
MLRTSRETSEFFVRVENTGDVAGDVAVICYVAATKQDVVAVPPLRSVFDFYRVEELQPGKSTLVSLTLTPRGRALVTEAGEWVTPVGEYEAVCEAGGVAKTSPAAFTVA